jgi:hypothetical protein
MNVKKKETKEMIEKERDLLKITLDYYAKENSALKRQLEDLAITARSNKELLKEYVERITNKDEVVEKLRSTNEQLQARLSSLEEYIKSNNIGSGGK